MPAEKNTDTPLGSFEPKEAKRLLPALEQHQISFEIETDHSALSRPGRFVELALGMYPEGSKLIVYVADADLERAQDVAKSLFSV